MDDIIGGETKVIDPVSYEEIRQALERLLSDAAFFCADRNRRFLQYIVGEYCADRAKGIKAYTVAVDVFGRGVDFDATHDPIVRIEATRLRTALRQYYDMHPEVPLRIDLPKGRYAPAFTRRRTASSLRSSAVAQLSSLLATLRQKPPEGLQSETQVSPRRARAFTVAAVIAVPVLITWGFLDYQSLQPSALSEKPTVAIDMQIADRDDAAAARPIEDDIMVGISQFQNFRLAAPTSDPRAFYTPPAAAGSAGNRRADFYRVTMKYSSDVESHSIWWQVTDGSSGEVLRSGVERVLPMPFSDNTPAQELARMMSVRLAGRHGVIADLETAREMAAPSLGNGCVLRAIAVMDGFIAKQSALSCLNATLEIAPNDVDANAMLAILTAVDDPSRALELANRAVSLGPSSDRARISQSIAYFEKGKADAAITAGQRAMMLNPGNGMIAAKLGWMLFLSGRFDEGVAMAIKAGLIDTDPHHDAALTLALDAYRTGQFDEAALRVSQIDDSGSPIVDILQAATLGQQGRSVEAGAVIKTIKDQLPDFESTFRSFLQARHYSPALVDTLQAGLVKAGLRLQQ